MFRSALALLVLALCFAALASTVTAEDDTAFVRKTFDVSAITTPMTSHTGPALGAVLWQTARQLRNQRPELESRPYLPGEHMMDLLRTWTGPDAWEREGAWIEYRESLLVIRNSPEVIRAVEAELYRLAAAAQQRVLLHIEVREQGDAVGGCRISGSLELPVGLPQSVAVTSRVDYVADYEVEIAQGSNISNPVAFYLDEGLVVDAVAHPLLDGERVLLEAHIQFCCLEEMRELELGTDEEYFAQGFRSPDRFPNGRVQLPGCSHADVHVSTVVRTGEDVLLPVVSGDRRATLRLHVDMLDPARPGPLLGVSALTTPAFRLRAGSRQDLEEGDHDNVTRLYHQEGEGRGPLGGTDEVVELVHTGVHPVRWEEGDERLDAMPNQLIAVTARPDLLGAVREFLAAREAEAVRPVSLEVAVLSVQGGVTPGPGRELDPELVSTVAQARLHTISGRWAAVRLGTTQNYVVDYDVEVAQESRIPDPIVGQSFGGLAANLRPHLPLVGRTVRVDLDLLFSMDELAKEAFDSGTQYLGPIEQVQARRTRIDTSIGVPLGGRTLLDAGPDPRNPGARLVLAVTAKTP